MTQFEQLKQARKEGKDVVLIKGRNGSIKFHSAHKAGTKSLLLIRIDEYEKTVVVFENHQL